MRTVPLASVVVGLACGLALAAFAPSASADASAVAGAPPPVASEWTPPTAAVAYGDPCGSPCLRWHVTVGAWIWGLDGTLGTGGREAEVDSDWTDTLEHVDAIEFALNARVRAEWGPWSASVQLDGADVGDSVTFREGGRLTIDADASVWILQAQVGHVCFGGPLGCSPCAPSVCVEAYAGLRAYFLSIDLEASQVGPEVHGSEDWVDPIVGIRADFTFGPRWGAVLEADVGGFGAGSDLSWNLLAAVRHRFSGSVALSLGWRVLDVDYENGDFVFDVRMSGPLLALTFTF
jgi:hypothetical protein